MQIISLFLFQLRLINPESEYVQKISELLYEDDSGLAAWTLRTESALLVDAVNMFSRALNDRRKLSSVPLVSESNRFICETTNSWEHGYSVVNSMKTVSNKEDNKFVFFGCHIKNQYQYKHSNQT